MNGIYILITAVLIAVPCAWNAIDIYRLQMKIDKLQKIIDDFKGRKLPELETIKFPEEWIASLKGHKVLYGSGKTEKEAVSELMKSIKVILTFNKDNHESKF